MLSKKTITIATTSFPARSRPVSPVEVDGLVTQIAFLLNLVNVAVLEKWDATQNEFTVSMLSHADLMT